MSNLSAAMTSVDEEDAAREEQVGGAGEPFADSRPKLAVVETHQSVAEMVNHMPPPADADARSEPDAESMLAELKATVDAEAVLDDQDWADVMFVAGRAMKRGKREAHEILSTDARALRTMAELVRGIRLTKRDTPDAELVQAIVRGQAVDRALAGGAA